MGGVVASELVGGFVRGRVDWRARFHVCVRAGGRLYGCACIWLADVMCARVLVWGWVVWVCRATHIIECAPAAAMLAAVVAVAVAWWRMWWRRRARVCVCACCFASPLGRAREATRDRATHISDCARATAIWAVAVAVVIVVACVVAACVCVCVCVCVARGIAAIAVDQQRCARWRWWWRWWLRRNWSHRLVRRSAAERRPRGARDAKRSRAWSCQSLRCHCATQLSCSGTARAIPLYALCVTDSCGVRAHALADWRLEPAP